MDDFRDLNISQNMEITPTPNDTGDIQTPQEDKTFNTLKRIQSLLKRESSLKKLCK
jgi:hypothetical protein